MPFQHATAFGTSYGNLTDDERLGAQQGMNANAIAAQMAALNAEIADRQAGRSFQGGQADKDRAFQGTQFDKGAGLQKDLDASATARAFGTVDRQMGPANIDAGIRQREANVKLPIEEARGAFQLQALKAAMGGMGAGAAGTPGAPGGAAPQGGGLDPDATMFMAWGGNPGEYMQNKRIQANSDRTHQDALDARDLELAKSLIASGKPEAVALGTQILSKGKGSALSGQDPATLQTALQPEVDAASAITKSPAVQLSLDNAATLLANASKVGGDAGSIEQAKPLIEKVIADLKTKGVRPEDAQAYVTNEMKRRLPANAGLGTLLGELFTGPIGWAYGAAAHGAQARTKDARKAAGLVD